MGRRRTFSREFKLGAVKLVRGRLEHGANRVMVTARLLHGFSGMFPLYPNM